MAPKLSKTAKCHLLEFEAPEELERLEKRWDKRRPLSEDDVRRLNIGLDSRHLLGNLHLYELDGYIFLCEGAGETESVINVIPRA